MKVFKVISIAKSCKTVDQLAACIQWAAQVLPNEEKYLFVEAVKHLPNADLAVYQVKKEVA